MPRKLSKRAEKRKSGREVVRATVWLDVDVYEGTLRACEKGDTTLAKFVNETLKKKLEELQAQTKKRKRRAKATTKPPSKRVQPPASAPRSRKATSMPPPSKGTRTAPRSRRTTSMAPPEPTPSSLFIRAAPSAAPRSRRSDVPAPSTGRSTIPPRSSRR